MYKYLSLLSNLIYPELSHSLFLNFLKLGLIKNKYENKNLNIKLWNKNFSNPLGLAAGFDKNAEVISETINLGFGFVEVGTVTLNKQIGNAKPRVFKIPEHEAVIQRLGFNNMGVNEFSKNINISRKKSSNSIIGINIGKNKETIDYEHDYLNLLNKCKKLADYIVVNVSSPNTPGLRDIQKKDKLLSLLKILSKANQKSLPILVKISPDISNKSLEDICEIAINENLIDGLILTNTTISRDSLKNKQISNSWKISEVGGLSGPPLFKLSNEVLEKTYKFTGGKIPLIGVGGISSGKDAFEKISLGASLIQIYTCLIYKGPNIVYQILEELSFLLKKNGFKNINDAIGHKIK
tara:strand:+ start:290 stop:1345 length:1056 start_codon:yes stop_codon:yes gene_type:complete